MQIRLLEFIRVYGLSSKFFALMIRRSTIRIVSLTVRFELITNAACKIVKGTEQI